MPRAVYAPESRLVSEAGERAESVPLGGERAESANALCGDAGEPFCPGKSRGSFSGDIPAGSPLLLCPARFVGESAGESVLRGVAGLGMVNKGHRARQHDD